MTCRAAGVLATGLFVMACQRVDPPAPALALRFTAPGPHHVLPRALGDVVAVTTSREHPNWAQIWLVDGEGTIRAYYVSFNGQVERGLVITRQ